MKPIYHITPLDNLKSIVSSGGLLCDADLVAEVARGASVVGIAHQHIKDRRARKAVVVAARGTLAHYVPFYFAPRSPMLYAIYRGVVAGYGGGQERVVHLVSTVETACKVGQRWFFTDGHAEMEISKQFDQLTSLDKLDWNIMTETWWKDTTQDGDRKRRRQAEFLVHRAFPWTAVTQIGVMSDRIAALVRAALNGAEHMPNVVVRTDWYY